MKSLFLKLLLIFSPTILIFIYDVIWQSIYGPGGQEATAVALAVSIFLFAPFIAVVGLITSYFIARNRNLEKLPAIGFFFPALIIWIFMFYALIADVVSS